MPARDPGAGPGPNPPAGSAGSAGLGAGEDDAALRDWRGRALGGAVGAVLGLAALAAGLTAAGVHSRAVAGPALLFLLAGPGAALAWALPGQALRLRLLVALVGGLAVDTLIAQGMLSLRLWSPRAGALAALAVTAALLGCGLLATRRRTGIRTGIRTGSRTGSRAGIRAGIRVGTEATVTGETSRP